MVLQDVLLQLVASSATIVTLKTLEGLLLQVDSLMSDQMALFDEPASAGGTNVRSDGHMASHVGCQLRSTWGEVGTSFLFTMEDVTSVNAFVG